MVGTRLRPPGCSGYGLKPELPLRPQQGSLRQPRFPHAVFVPGAVGHVLREKIAVKNGGPSMLLQVS
jgi:hypothetical protein